MVQIHVMRQATLNLVLAAFLLMFIAVMALVAPDTSVVDLVDPVDSRVQVMDFESTP